MNAQEQHRSENPELSLLGKRAIVTGAGVGIGQGVAAALAARGAHVVVHHASTRPDETLALLNNGPHPAIAIRADLSDARECARLIEESVSALGGLDILVNNAGASVEKPIEVFDDAQWDALFAINARAPYLCTRAAAAPLADGGGSVINISSVHAFAGLPPSAAYAASKGAINAMTRALAMELIDRRIRVNAIAPGLIETPRYFTQDRVVPYTSEQGAKLVPWGRTGRPRDVGSLAAFIASDAADFITGQVIYTDGGTTSLLGLPHV